MDWVGDAARCAEMRRILTNILGFSELLADPFLSMAPGRRLEYVKIIIAAGFELNEKISELAQKSAGRQPISKSPFIEPRSGERFDQPKAAASAS